ncbi:MAG: carotenoid biosynthesis protein [Chloroflexota bacterium]
MTIDRVSLVFIGLWLLSMILVPIFRWTWGDTTLPLIVNISVVLHASATIAALLPLWGWRRCLALVALILPLTWGIERIGSSTGFPFGVYHYTDLLQPQLLHVPVVIPLAWLMMLPPSWVIAHSIIGNQQPLRFAALSATAFTAWDLFLDPQMVNWHFWVWETPNSVLGSYFGIPWTNYLGWWGCSFLLTWLVVMLIKPPFTMHSSNKPSSQLFFIYTITCLFEIGGLMFFWQLPGPAICGGIVMGGLCLWAWRRQFSA